MSYLIGIYEALHILFRDALADNWVTRPNSHAIFGGQKPLDYMAQGGIEALKKVAKAARCALCGELLTVNRPIVLERSQRPVMSVTFRLRETASVVMRSMKVTPGSSQSGDRRRKETQ